MDKVLVEVVIAILGQSFDMLLPKNLPVSQIVPLIAQMLEEATEGSYVSSGEEILILQDTGSLLQRKGCLEDFHVQNGDRILIY